MSGLAHDLETLRNRARWFILARGVGATVAVMVGGGLLLGGLDAVLRWQTPTGRWTETLIWLTCVMATGWKFLVQPLRTPLTNLDLAQIIHRHWPGQTPDLTSAVEFESTAFANDTGAPLLQQVTVSLAQRQLATVPWHSVVVPGRILGVTAMAIFAVGLLGVAALRSIETTSIGAIRLTSPWLDLDWPRRTTFVYLDSDFKPIDTSRTPALRAGQGEPLTLYIENRTGQLPSQVDFERRTQTGDIERGELRQATLNDAQGRPRQIAIASFPSTTSFEFRTRGGDDERAPWIKIDVVPPPRVESFEMTLTPPRYTGRPPETTTSGVGHLQGLVGTQVDIHCRAMTPLQSVVLSRGNEPRQPVTLSSDGREFQLAWTIGTAERSTYWLDLTDLHGLRLNNPPRYEIRGVADQVPVSTLVAPESDQKVTPHATITVIGQAQDDIGLQRTELVYELSRTDASSPLPDHSTLEQRSIALDPPHLGTIEQEISLAWNLSELNLPAGTQIRFWLQATDAYDLQGMTGQTGRSAVRVLTILSPEEKQQELDGQQMQLVDRLHQLRDKQSTIEQSTHEIITQYKSEGTLRPTDQQQLDQLQTQQKELHQELGKGSRSVLRELQNLREERTINRLTDTETDNTLDQWEATLKPLAEEIFPSILEHLDKARQGATQKTPAAPSPKEQITLALKRAHEGQLRSLNDLAHLSTDLNQWKKQEDLDKQIDEIASRQSAVREQSIALGQNTAGREFQNLSSQEQTDLARTADRQAQLAREVDHLASQLESAISDSEPSSSNESLTSTARQLADQSIAASMRSAAESLRDNHIQSATDTQQSLMEALELIKRGLGELQTHTARDELESLRHSIENANDLIQRQSDLHRRTERLSTTTADNERAAQSAEAQMLQQELTEDATDFAQRLRLDRKSDSSATAQRAGQQMREARERLEEEQIAEALHRQSEALDELREVQQSLNRALQETTAKADQERMSEVAQIVIALRARAQATHEETIRLESLRISQGKWSRSLKKSVQNAAESQRDIGKGCEQAGEQLASRGILGLNLKLASDHFFSASQRLEEFEAGTTTQADQLAAIHLLELFIASLSPPPTDPSRSSTQTDQSNSRLENHASANSPLMSAEVRLLLSMQEEITAQTRALAEQKASEQEFSTEQMTALQKLRERQTQLVNTAREMIEASAASGINLPVEEEQSP